jgi:Rit1 N-terminal domain
MAHSVQVLYFPVSRLGLGQYLMEAGNVDSSVPHTVLPLSCEHLELADTNSNRNRLHVLQRRLRASNECIRNRLLSIQHDSRNVSQACQIFSSGHTGDRDDEADDIGEAATTTSVALKVFANLRNGAWYVRPKEKHGECYFKSGDGHNNHWRFSQSRLNLELARAASSQICLVVDSTRQGKKFPDSLSATVPIWCSVINWIVLDMKGESKYERYADICLPPWMPRSQASRLRGLLPSFISSVPQATQTLIRNHLQCTLHKPLVPVWICPTEEDESLDITGGGAAADAVVEDVMALPHAELDFHPILLLSCSSNMVSENEHRCLHSWHYVQGAGDDEETWCMGLTPKLFWANIDHILADDVPEHVTERVKGIVESSSSSSSSSPFTGAEGSGCDIADTGTADVSAFRSTKTKTKTKTIDGTGVSIHIVGEEKMKELVLAMHVVHEGKICSQSSVTDDLAGLDGIIVVDSWESGTASDVIAGTDTATSSLRRERALARGAIGISHGALGSVPFIYITAATTKRDCTLNRGHWSLQNIPQILAFRKSLQATADTVASSARLVKVGFVCRNETVGCIGVLSLLLAASSHESLGSPITKDDVKTCLASLSLSLPTLNLPRRDMKEIHRFFIDKDGMWNTNRELFV